MGHFCRICKSRRPNEAFSGRGHRIHVCNRCARMPEDERSAIEQADEVFGFLRQKRISEKNISRLEKLAASRNSHTAKLAGIVLEVAKVKPYKIRRLKVLARTRRGLLQELEETGLILAHHW